jgi:hypothetical protein
LAQNRTLQTDIAPSARLRIRVGVNPVALILAFIPVFGASAWAQFETRARQTLGNNEFSIAAGDFNRDGKEDIVASGNEIFVLLGNGDGTFR